MARRPAPRSAGILLALLPLGGLAVGTVLRQPSLGLVIGIAAGVLLALAFWLADRRGR